ncbi:MULTISPECIES: phage tail tape measure protein [Photorhabdus]|nr:phage tail tape measure protein [Photorhabdus asymbiotica]RKS54725.1 TP901 family phage tail tape measure protein [Photorhabdus asymbiotica]
MSNTQSQLKLVIQSVNKLTSVLKSVQRNNRRLADSIRQNRGEFKRLNQTWDVIKPYSAPEYAQGTAHTSSKNFLMPDYDLNVQLSKIQAQTNIEKNSPKYTTLLNQSYERSKRAGVSASQVVQETAQTSRKKEESRSENRYSKIKDFRDRISQHGASAKSAGVNILTTSKNFLMPGYDLNAQMSKIQAQTNIEKNSPEYAMLLNQSRELSKSTGVSANQIAQGQSLYASKGYSSDQIKNMMPGTVSMSQANGADFAATIDIGTNVLEGFKLQSEEMSRVSDVLTATFTGSKTTLAALGDTMKFVAPTASSLGIDIETVAAATRKLSDANIKGSEAGEVLSSMLGRLAEPPKAAAAALAQLSIKIRDAKGNLRQLPDILVELDDKTRSMSSKQRTSYFTAIGGENAAPALDVLVNQAGQGELQSFIDKLRNVQGESQKVASTMTNSLTGDIQKLNAAWSDLGVQMFSGVEGPAREVTQKVTNVVNKVSEWMKANPRLAATLATITMVVGGVLTVFGAFAQAIASILLPLAVAKYSLTLFGSTGVRALGLVGNALKMLGSTMMIVGRLMMANPILAIVGLIAMAAVYIWQNWETLGPKFSQLWENIKISLSEKWESIKQSALQIWDNIKNNISNAWELVKQNTLDIWENIKISISDKWNEIITDVMNLPSKFKEVGTAIINSLLEGINEKWEVLKKKLTSLSDYIPDWMRPGEDTSKGTNNNMTHNVSSVLPKHDKGGIIPAGGFGIVGEYGPEIVTGPVNVISRRQTAKLAAAAAFSLSVMAPSAAARTAPLHIQSLPVQAYPQIQEKVEKRHQIQYRNESPVYHINIYGAPGQSAQDIAAVVRRELDDRERKQQARLRSSFSDRGEF